MAVARKRVVRKEAGKPGPRGHIEELILENFKSYAGGHQIGPFDKFTCVIGPNGSGKSNIMDAISFCLGIKARHLRGDRLKDLIYRREEESSEANTRSARVTMAFRTAQGERMMFSRTITARGGGAYQHGPPGRQQNVSYEEYTRLLEEQSIFVKARNFLVFQGDVMELARRQGSDLSGVLETISGSDQFKEEYNRLASELELAQERARLHFQHRREVEGAMAVLEQQRAEVERYHALRTQRAQLSTETVLFKLYCAEREERRLREASEGLQVRLAVGEGELKTQKKELDEMEAQRKELEAETERAHSQHYAVSSNLEQLKPEIGNCRKEIQHWTKRLQEGEEKVKQEMQKVSSMMEAGRQAREDREKMEAKLERLQARPVESKVKMTEAQRAEYEKAVAHTDNVNSKVCEWIRQVEEQLTTAGRELAADGADLRDIQERRMRGAQRLEELAQEKTAVNIEFEREATGVQQKRKVATSLAEDLRKFQMFKDTLIEEQRQMRFKLDSAKARRERLEQAEARQRVADELRERFPVAVLGRISELVLPSQRRFELPLQQSLGNMAEAFLVRTADAAHECVQYLKTKKIGSETFLPLDRMTAPKVGALHLITQGHDARRLATLCMQHNTKFFGRHVAWQTEGPGFIDKTLEFLLNATVIVDDLEEAKRTAYIDARARNLLPRVVTLDGEVIHPNGNMSVQCSSQMGRVEFGGIEQLKEIRRDEEKLRGIEKDLSTLEEEEQKKKRQEVLAMDAQRALEDKHSSLQNRLKNVEAAQASEKEMVAGRAHRIVELEARKQRAKGEVAEHQAKKETFEARLLEAGRKFFAKLNRELGVGDIREAMQREQRERRLFREEIEKCEDLIRGFETEERQAELRAKGSSKLDALRRECNQLQQDVQANEERLKNLNEKERERTRLFLASQDKLKELKLRKEALEQDSKAKKADMQTMKQQAGEARTQLKKQNDKVRVILVTKCKICRDCDERQIEIPFVGGRDEVALERVLARERELEDFPFQELQAACAALRVDYEDLPLGRQQEAKNAQAYDGRTIEAEYEAKVAEINKELETLNPNMRAVEECNREATKLRDLRQKADEANRESQRLAREFDGVKSERVARFMRCFKHVEAKVNPYYRELTSYDGHEGGSAYLDLDDAEEPYNGGITFTACPPGKRFFPMELLSGGEKSMASMSLLFAMHSYMPPPFMILDEVDAPLDRKNTGSLVGYLRKLDFQCLVISLKDTFFSHSDSIVGIFKDKEAQTSGSLSLPLRQLSEARPAAAARRSESSELGVPVARALQGL